ncbi:MAG: phosphatase PAP2 family protein [Ignavibacteriae bacterium]|nr:phosphatase PAP2 family protein [Ignavibacteriota bacterium]
MIFRKSIYKSLSATDLVIIFFYLFLISINLIFHNLIDEWILLTSLNISLIILVLFFADKAEITKSKIWENVHFYYVVPLIFLSFKEVYILLDAIHSSDYDSLLIAADRFLFGLDPTIFLYQFANPILTEILQIAYGTFFFLPIILGVEFQLKHKSREFDFIIFLVVYGFFLSYVGYFLLPAVGPRFTLHNFETTNLELPGIFLTNFLREIINSGESIPSGTINPFEVVQRDVFPSGHTQMTLIVMYLAVKLKSSNKLFFLIDGSLLIFATVYLRYHYVIDLIGGVVFMIFTILTGKYLFNWWQKKTGSEVINY